MNTPNPLIPQGSLLEQKAKAKPPLRAAYIIVAIHLVFLGGLLIQGCKKDDATGRISQLTNETALPPLDQSNLYPSNSVAQATNPAQDLVQTAAPPVTNVSLPVTQPVVEPTVPGATRDYVVLKGDTYTSIGKKHGVSRGAIARANPGVDATRLKVGQKLVIPSPASSGTAALSTVGGGESAYVVKTGDTLMKIAKANSTTVNEIKTLNGKKTDRITVGEKLKLPGVKSAPLVAPAAVTNSGNPGASPSGGPGNL